MLTTRLYRINSVGLWSNLKGQSTPLKCHAGHLPSLPDTLACDASSSCSVHTHTHAPLSLLLHYSLHSKMEREYFFTTVTFPRGHFSAFLVLADGDVAFPDPPLHSPQCWAPVDSDFSGHVEGRLIKGEEETLLCSFSNVTKKWRLSQF